MISIDELKRKQRDLNTLVKKAEEMTGAKAHVSRGRDALRKREQRSEERLVVIPQCADRARRAELEADDIAWLRFYFSDCGYYTESVFWYDFTPQQLAMIEAIGLAVREGGDYAVAASRGEGKTTIARRLILKYGLQGLSTFSVLFNATGAGAEDSLQAIKQDVEQNNKLLADYPESCYPVRALQDTPNRAHYMLVNGFRHDNGSPYEMAAARFSWCGQQVRFPRVPGSPSTGSIIATRGLDAAVVGLNKLGKRPKIALIDDADTDKTVYSPEQADKLEERIDKSIGGLGSQQKMIARVMLCTARNRTCCAWRFTCRKGKPSWRGVRQRFLVKKPDREDLWNEYIALQQEDWRNGTTLASDFYLANFEAMNVGHEVANPNRKAEHEHSALQHYYNLVAKLGAEAVATEYDNDPPELESLLAMLVITPSHIQYQRLSGFGRRIVPPGIVAITIGADVQKLGLHWVVIGWTAEGVGSIIHYDFHEFLTANRKAADCELLILEGLRAWRDMLGGHPFKMDPSPEHPEGLELTPSLTLIDTGWREESWNNQPVSVFCAEAGFDRFRPSKGVKPYKRPQQTIKRIIGNEWHIEAVGGVPTVFMNTDHWKLKVHEGFLADPGEPGSLVIFDLPRTANGRINRTAHISYANHICAETWDQIKNCWSEPTKPNHYFDATYQAVAARSLCGIDVISFPKVETPKKPALISTGRSNNNSRW